MPSERSEQSLKTEQQPSFPTSTGPHGPVCEDALQERLSIVAFLRAQSADCRETWELLRDGNQRQRIESEYYRGAMNELDAQAGNIEFGDHNQEAAPDEH